ncbi:transcriptional regulator, GntR family [Anaerovirgula multivorans]|uniref:Transcriptional regulator, GntR family n=1 Tax=Anaerovirgula multivorans TaxID=312168 RepID=A0A239JC06_9FIRM|nr:PLP-dependent aminotransferase family protein [Anaerovirgula multivorans]SNT03576.1 transcriptional regulator, GntR family [Anaerovirgula multivorans]
MWNPKTIDTDKSLYIAIAEALERDIRNGILKPGYRMPTHRELADIIGVNVTTASRAYKEAERRGLISGIVGRGTYVTADLGMDSSMMKIEEKVSKMIEMGLVLPLYSKEPDISRVIENVLKSNQMDRFLRYTDPLGLPDHRETGAYWVKRFDIKVSWENIVICAGAQHALTCCLSSIFEVGDRIATDSLTYPGIKTVAKTLGMKLEPIQMDEEGMIPESLEAACHRNPIKGLYLMPNMQNPTTSSMSMKRKKEIANIVEGYNLTLLEDDIYSFTNQSSMQAIASLIPENSIYIAGVSKAFYAGLRIAYVVVPKRFRYKVAQAVVNTIWMAPTLNAAIVSECIRDGTADKIISWKLEEISKRFEVAKEKLSNYCFSGNNNNFYIWLKLPNYWSGKEIELAARERGINIFSADKFAVGGEVAPSAIRISLSGTETIEELSKGLDILERILSNEYITLDPIL